MLTSTLKKLLGLISLICLGSGALWAQTSLNAGDIAFVELQGDTPDRFAFVLLVDVDENTEIYLSDNGWLGASNSLRSGEGIITWTAPAGGLTAGTVVSISGTAASAGTIATVSGSVALSTSGDQILAWQGTSTPTTFIAAVTTHSTVWASSGATGSSTTSDLPAGLTDGVNAVAVGAGPGIGDEFDNAQYDPSLCATTTGTASEMATIFNTAANWVGNNSAFSTAFIDATDCGTFTITTTPTTPPTSLNAGDIAFVELQGDTPDRFAFVVLTDIGGGTEIYLSDNGWLGASNSLRSGEGIITWTAPTGGLTTGTVVSISGTTASTGTVATVSGSLALSTSGDQILAWQGTSTPTTFIAAVTTHSTVWASSGATGSSTTSDLPAGLTDGVNAVAVGAGPGIGDEFDNAQYDPSLCATTTGTASELAIIFNTAANWVGNNSAFSTAFIDATDCGAFTVTEAPTALLCESFETDGDGTRYTLSNSFNDGVNDHFGRTDGSDIANISGAYSGANGTFYIAGEDFDDGGGDGLDEKTVTFSSVTTANFTNLTFKGLFAAGNENGVDASAYDMDDFIIVSFSTDGGSTFSKGLEFRYVRFDDDFNEPLAQDTDFDGIGDGTVLNTTFQEFAFDIPDAATVILKIEAHMESANEEIAFDNIKIEGTEKTSTCTDVSAPIALCQPTLDVMLDENGVAAIDAATLDNGSTDDCTDALALAFSTDVTELMCANTTAPFTVTLTVEDLSGKTSTCTTQVQAVDNILPVITPKTGVSVALDASGAASIVTADVSAGSTDNCGIQSSVVSPNTFDCEDIKPADAVDASSLIISEIVEGSGFVKYIEIFNGTGTDVDLSDFQVETYFNGSSSAGQTLVLSGTLINGQTLIIANPSASSQPVVFTGTIAFTDNVANFNGDDAVAIRRISDNALVDVFGVIGEDPGTQWSVNGVNTQNQTLRRVSSTTGGIIPTAGFPELDDEWIEFPQNTIDGLGMHTMDGFYAGVPVTITTTDVNNNVAIATANVFVTDPTNACGCNVMIDNIVLTDEKCQGEQSGKIEMTASGASMLEYSKDGGLTWQMSNVFDMLSAGTYELLARDKNDPTCVSALETQTIAPGTFPRPELSYNTTDASCLGDTDGSITVNVSAPTTGPFMFAIDGGAFVAGSLPFTFSNLGAGDHPVLVKDGNGCVSEMLEVPVKSNGRPTFKLNAGADATGPNTTDGSVIVEPQTGTAPYMYSTDNGQSFQAGPKPATLTGLAAGDYLIRIKDANGCVSEDRPYTVNDLTVCPPRTTLNRIFKANGSRDNIKTRNVCEGGVFTQDYKVLNLPSGWSFRLDWILEETGGEENEGSTFNGSVPVPNAISNSITHTANGVYAFDADGGIMGLEYLAERSDRITFSWNPVLIVGSGAECAATPTNVVAIVYPTAEAMLDNAMQPGQTITLASGSDPNGKVSIKTPVPFSESNSQLVYDLHIDATAGISELGSAIDVMSFGNDKNNRDYDGFGALASAGITSLTNTTNVPVKVTVEVTPINKPGDSRASACPGVKQSIDIWVLPGSAPIRAAEQLSYEVYPNPVKHMLQIVVTPQDMVQRYELVDLQGRTIERGVIEVGQTHTRLDMSSVAEGLYIVRFFVGEELTDMVKVQKQ